MSFLVGAKLAFPQWKRKNTFPSLPLRSWLRPPWDKKRDTLENSGHAQRHVYLLWCGRCPGKLVNSLKRPEPPPQILSSAKDKRKLGRLVWGVPSDRAQWGSWSDFKPVPPSVTSSLWLSSQGLLLGLQLKKNQLEINFMPKRSILEGCLFLSFTLVRESIEPPSERIYLHIHREVLFGMLSVT